MTILVKVPVWVLLIKLGRSHRKELLDDHLGPISLEHQRSVVPDEVLPRHLGLDLSGRLNLLDQVSSDCRVLLLRRPVGVVQHLDQLGVLVLRVGGLLLPLLHVRVSLLLQQLLHHFHLLLHPLHLLPEDLPLLGVCLGLLLPLVMVKVRSESDCHIVVLEVLDDVLLRRALVFTEDIPRHPEGKNLLLVTSVTTLGAPTPLRQAEVGVRVTPISGEVLVTQATLVVVVLNFLRFVAKVHRDSVPDVLGATTRAVVCPKNIKGLLDDAVSIRHIVIDIEGHLGLKYLKHIRTDISANHHRHTPGKIAARTLNLGSLAQGQLAPVEFPRGAAPLGVTCLVVCLVVLVGLRVEEVKLADNLVLLAVPGHIVNLVAPRLEVSRSVVGVNVGDEDGLAIEFLGEALDHLVDFGNLRNAELVQGERPGTTIVRVKPLLLPGVVCGVVSLLRDALRGEVPRLVLHNVGECDGSVFLDVGGCSGRREGAVAVVGDLPLGDGVADDVGDGGEVVGGEVARDGGHCVWGEFPNELAKLGVVCGCFGSWEFLSEGGGGYTM